MLSPVQFAVEMETKLTVFVACPLTHDKEKSDDIALDLSIFLSLSPFDTLSKLTDL
jgi:hypothetical protein